jgi:hypothetical protein
MRAEEAKVCEDVWYLPINTQAEDPKGTILLKNEEFCSMVSTEESKVFTMMKSLSRISIPIEEGSSLQDKKRVSTASSNKIKT